MILVRDWPSKRRIPAADAWLLRTFTRSNFSVPDHRQMVCNSKFIGSQSGNRGNENPPGVVTGVQKNAR